MCNHYENDVRKLGAFLNGVIYDNFSEKRIPLRFSNLPSHVYPKKLGLVGRKEGDGLALETMYWGFPPPPWAKPPAPVTNLRHPEKAYWKPWLGVENRCVVFATSFFEPDQHSGKDGAKKVEVEFARADGEAFCFAGLWRTWEGNIGTKKAPMEGTHQLFTFLTTDANADVFQFHEKAMPVILSEDEVEAWLSAPANDAFKLFQRPLPDGELVVVGTREYGTKEVVG